MTTAFLSPPTGLPNILMIRKYRFLTPVWRRGQNIVIWRANIAPDIFPARCFLILKRFPIAHRRCRI